MVESRALDTVELIQIAGEIGDMINASREMADYLYWKSRVESDLEVQRLIREFNQVKEKFKECERFGHFHPDYHQALDEVKRFEQHMEQNEAVRHFKQAENRLDELLHEVSLTIAHAVSEEIKVPGNNPLPTVGCASGGTCSGRCG